ncbi:UDP-N-acetylbacillosamine N-acetyltransferase [Poriferisphaera corsica]|uniref:UDP-N-acetylbacillosamine N-acetyltransferase n=1 Tax=Poriferisphaera corsica TaxID=2528020 RepID=A0A517YTY1_9BACT|nr:acetyltransferase [Poriferisphaera corsica]QDU33681.1 UDP-N-acetylbacillosamine N-acetyltransferase [Poriferisphaera corsica]
MTDQIKEKGQGALLIYGAGGHGHVIAEAAKLAGFQVLGFVDDEAKLGDEMSLPLFQLNDERVVGAAIIVAVGDNLARRRITSDLVASGRHLANVVHPSAMVSESVGMGQGVFVGAGSIINSCAFLRDGVVINSGAVVEHHCQVNEYAHVGPGCVMGGGVSVGTCAMVGLGSRVLPRVKIGAYATIGAGAVVTTDVRESARVVGMPAKELSQVSAS